MMKNRNIFAGKSIISSDSIQHHSTVRKKINKKKVINSKIDKIFDHNNKINLKKKNKVFAYFLLEKLHLFYCE